MFLKTQHLLKGLLFCLMSKIFTYQNLLRLHVSIALYFNHFLEKQFKMQYHYRNSRKKQETLFTIIF